MPQSSRLRALAAATLTALVIVTIQPPAPAAAASPAAVSPAAASRADRVIAIALAERGSPWVFGATGPRAFDCSGLVAYAFRRAGVLEEIGGGRNRSGGALLRWARAHRLTRSTGHRGDVVVWGNGAHVGIYLGNGKAISTLTSGVRIHGLRVLNTRFTTFISTSLSGAAPAAATAKAASASAATGQKVVARREVAVLRLNVRSAPRVTAAISRPRPRHPARRGPLHEGRDRPNLVPGGRRDTGRLGRRLADAPRALTRLARTSRVRDAVAVRSGGAHVRGTSGLGG